MSKKTPVYRVQARDGRGPFRPGFSVRWKGDRDIPPSFLEELPGVLDVIYKAHDQGFHIGTGCRSVEALQEWFTDEEMKTLRSLGYDVVVLSADRILAESPSQVVFASKRPLRKAVIMP